MWIKWKNPLDFQITIQQGQNTEFFVKLKKRKKKKKTLKW